MAAGYFFLAAAAGFLAAAFGLGVLDTLAQANRTGALDGVTDGDAAVLATRHRAVIGSRTGVILDFHERQVLHRAAIAHVGHALALVDAAGVKQQPIEPPWRKNVRTVAVHRPRHG